ncbi:PIN domain-containing protein [Candidatus Daviesbacteria bacterium]|nr:PIN domain-containing protein [Candidatus Daviesbacteria bacterium]
MYLLDTNVFILGLRGEEPEANLLKKAIQNNKLFISSVVIGEFLSKITEQEAESFYILVEMFKVLPVDKEVAVVAAEYRKTSLKTKRIHLLDCFLAAQAKLQNLILVTNNKSDFPMKDVRTITPSQY